MNNQDMISPDPINQTETPVAPTTPALAASASPRKSSLLPWLISLALLIAAAAAVAYFSMASDKAKKESASLNTQITALKDNTHDLPADAVKLSECIPNMGFHYVPKGGDPIYGPIYTVNKAGKITGVEYMFSNDMFTAIPNTIVPVSVVTKDSPMYDWKYNHVDVSHTPEGHHGYLVDHKDIHMYTVTPEERKLACQ